MQHITLGNIQNAVEDMLTQKLPVLQSFDSGAAAVKRFTLQLDKIKALPAALKGRAYADELEEEDENHDGFGGAVRCICDAYLRVPKCKPEVRAAAKNVGEAFIPTLSELKASYEEEATAAKNRRQYLVTLQADMMRIPVVDGTLLDWATEFVGSGEKLSVLLSARADAKNRKMASTLRTQTLGMVTRLRKDLAIDMENDPSLPADLDAKLFAYFDMLEAKDAADAAAAKKKRAAEKAEKEKEGATQPDAPPAPAAPATPVDPKP